MTDTEKGIPLPDDILSELRSSKTAYSENESGEDIEIGKLPETQFKMYVKAGGWLAKLVDEKLKEAGGPGFDTLPPDNFAKLAVIAFEEEIATKLAEDAPKALFYSVCAGLLVQNGVAIARNRTKKKKQQEAEKQQENEQN